MKAKWAEYIRHYEGLRLKPYVCPAGHLTIGYGHNLQNGITQEIAEHLLRVDLSCAQMEVGGKLPWSSELDDVRQFVLVDMCFNMGLTKLLTFKKFLAALEKKDYPLAAKEMLNSRWAEQVGRRANELAEMMKTGEYICIGLRNITTKYCN